MNILEELERLNIKNPYMLLELPQTATEEEIKHAYREKVKKYGNDQNRKNPDGEYLQQIFTIAYNALTNKNIRRIIDERIAKQKEGYEIVTKSVSSEKKTNAHQKDLAQELKLQDIIESYGLNKNTELSYADIQLILKEYIKRNWNRFYSGPTGNQVIEGYYILLSKAGAMNLVYEISGYEKTAIRDVFSGLDLLSSSKSSADERDATSYWNTLFENRNENTRLVSLASVYPEHVFLKFSSEGFMQKVDLIQGMELGNECLLKLRKNGYLKPTTPNEYIR